MMIIGLKGIKVIAPVGVYTWEREKGRKFIIDLELKIDDNTNLDDNIHNTINYELVLSIVKDCLKQEYSLIETAASAVSQKLFAAFPDLRELKIRMEKLKPIPGESLKSAFVERIFKQM